MILPVTLSIAAAAAVVNLWLALRIVTLRLKRGVLHGDGGESVIERRMRAQGNFVEYAPFVLILMGLIELAGGSALWLWIVGAVFIVARIAHGFGIEKDGSNPARAGGIVATWAVLALLAGWGAIMAYQGVRTPPVVTVPLDGPRTA